jgi:glycosyltransferase involved in cell wall biosynthesis
VTGPGKRMAGQHALGCSIGTVVIGRNEGDRLKRCLESIDPAEIRVVYVDSGSTDGSVEMALGMGIEVLNLDTSIPFCAARARNEGYARLLEIEPGLQFVQFVDGDCELVGDWLATAASALENRSELAIVAGWLRERHPERSIYNRLGDLEWNFAGVGAVDSVGGIFMVRREAFDSVGGFDPTVAAGEEPELCRRLLAGNWRICRLDCNMAWHDLAMTRFVQWWKRMIRFGYGSMDVAVRFDLPRFRRNNWRVRAWSLWLLIGGLLGLTAILIPRSPLSGMAALLWLGVWPAQLCRIAYRTWRKGQASDLSAAYAFFIMVSLWPQFLGQLLYFLDRYRNRTFRLLEYKTSGKTVSPSVRNE